MSTLFGRDVGDSGRAACDVVVLGSLVMDRKYFAAGTFAAALPVWGVQRQHGGVGRNVAVNTARLGGRTAFAGLSGFGPDAVDLETELSALGVHLEVLRTEAGIGRFDVLLDERGRQITSTIELPDPASAKSLCGPALAAVIGRAKAVVAEGASTRTCSPGCRERPGGTRYRCAACPPARPTSGHAAICSGCTTCSCST